LCQMGPNPVKSPPQVTRETLKAPKHALGALCGYPEATGRGGAANPESGC
jgi:hypothetical protein